MMKQIDIVVLCPNGRNRSRYLKEHLRTLGYDSHAIGINHKSVNAERRIMKARVIISVEPEVEETLRENYELGDVRLITLDVPEQPMGDARSVTGEEWMTYQRDVVYPALEKGLKKHLPL